MTYESLGKIRAYELKTLWKNLEVDAELTFGFSSPK